MTVIWCLVRINFGFWRAGEVKSSSPSESPLMEKNELHDAHNPILKPVPEESSVVLSSNTSPPPAHEDRRVTFDIGDADDADHKDFKETETSNGKSMVCLMVCHMVCMMLCRLII